MKQFNSEDLRKFQPCYDPNKYLEENTSFTIIDILDHEQIPFEDKLWVILRTDFVSERTMRLFAVWSYRQTLQWVKNPDPRSIAAADIAERFANGENVDLWSAADAATYAAADAARSAARSAAWSAADAAASAAYAATYAAWSAYADAAWSAARSAARSAASAAARSAASAAQQTKLREMILAGIGTGDTK